MAANTEKIMQLTDRVMVLTGGARGIGFEVAAVLKANNARLALLDLDQAALNEAVEKLGGADGSCLCLRCLR